MGSAPVIAEIVIASLLIYARFAPTDEEMGACLAWAEKLWQRLNSASGGAWRSFANVLQLTSRSTSTLFDRVFGPRVFSAQGVLITLALCAVSFEMLNAWFHFRNEPVRVGMGNLVLAGILALFGITPVVVGARKSLLWLFLFLGWWMVTVVLFYAARPSDPSLRIVATSFFLGAAFDFAWLALLRIGLRKALMRKQVLLHVVVLVVSAAVGASAFFLTPGFTNLSIIKWYLEHVHVSLAGLFTLVNWGSTRLFITAIATLYVTILGFFLMRGIAYHLVARLAYAAHKSDVIKERKGFLAIAGVLLAHAFGGFSELSEIIGALE